MLKSTLLHPGILYALSVNGHGARILIADGNFPIMTRAAPGSRKVFLNLAPGLLNVTDVLAVLYQAVPVESAIIMAAPDDSEQVIHREFRAILGNQPELKALKRFEFYEQAASSDTCLVIATGDMRRFANLLLTIGVNRPVEGSRPGPA